MKNRVIAISGDSGSGKTTLSNSIKELLNDSFVLECDRYHKWDRNNENWKIYTHLNPEANDISKMYDDILRLKNDLNVYQAKYDHKTGKFTEKHLIKPSSNIIVCGLHTFYKENSNLYDFKIFLDTDKELKTKWKIKRDVEERNHQKDSVLLQIKNRETDFNNYVYPQKQDADIIVNFFPINDSKIGLRIYFDTKHNTTKIDDVLKKNKITYTRDTQNNLICYEFLSDSDSIKLENELPIVRGDFYDYIAFFIISIVFQ